MGFYRFSYWKGCSTIIVQGQEVGEWVCEKAGGQWNTLCQAIGQVTDGKFVIGVLYNGYTGSSISIHSRCDIPAKVSREFYWAIFNYPFNVLKVKRLTGLVSTANLKAQKLDEHLGFERETIIKDYFPDGDGIVYIMRPETCRFLKLGDRYAK